MGKMTLECVEKELREIVDCPMTMENLRLYVLLCQAKEYMHKWDRRGGHALTREDAERWVKHMTPAARWTMEQTTSVMQQKGYKHDPHVFFAVMNSMASDYGKTIAKYGMDKPEVWAELTNDWLEDDDAVDGKAEVYYREIVKH